MPSIRTLYNDELVAAQRSAVAVLHQLMHETDDPLERRRIAIALLRSRLADDGTLPPPRSGRKTVSRLSQEQTGEPSPSAPSPADAAAEPPAAEKTEQATLAHSVPAAEPTVSTLEPPVPAPAPHVDALDTGPGPAPPGFRDCTHPALPPYPGMPYRELMKKARRT